jgi:hypothetical protein
MQPLLTQLLGLPGLEVQDYSDLGNKLILKVEVTTEQPTYPRCSFITVTPGSRIGRTQFWAIVKNLLGFGNCNVGIVGFLVKESRLARYCFWVLPRSSATTLWFGWVL